jgi:hypothetical protein
LDLSSDDLLAFSAFENSFADATFRSVIAKSFVFPDHRLVLSLDKDREAVIAGN